MKNKHLLFFICVALTISSNVSAQKLKSNKSLPKVSTSKPVTVKPPLIKQTARLTAKNNTTSGKPIFIKDDDEKDDDEFKASFRYVIIDGVSEVERIGNETPDHFLKFEVLMEDKAFNEDNLIILHELLDKRFAATSAFYARVYTSLDAIRTPEENDRLDQKGPIEGYFNYKNAFLARNAVGEAWVEYTIPGVITNEYVLLKEGKQNQ